MKFAVVDQNNSDPVESVWVKFSEKEQAEAWIKNYNENSQRKRNFAIKVIE